MILKPDFWQRWCLPVTLAGMLSACMTTPVQPDYDAKIEREQQTLPAWPEQQGAETSSFLTDLLQSEQLEQLLRTALANNPGLQQTWITLQQRQAQLKQTNAARLPQISANGTAERSEDSANSFSTQIEISWQADLWRKLAADNQAALSDIQEQKYLLQAARDSLAAEVMIAWLNLTATRHAIQIEQNRLATLSQNEGFIIQRYRNGLGTLEDLDNARSAVSRSKATLEANQESFRQQQRDLKQLLGIPAAEPVVAAETYPDVGLALADLPEQTLARRPDLQAAYAAIEAAQHRTEVAYKDLLPSLDLSASLRDIAETPHESLLSSPVWALLGQLTAPIFQGGRLRANISLAELDAAYQYQAYRDTLLVAVNEVEQALSLEQTLQIQQQHIEAALQNIRNSLEQYQRSYRTGLVDILDLLSVQQQTFDLEAQLDDLIFQRLRNRINLGLALGLGVPA